MSKLVASVVISSVADLHAQWAIFARSYDRRENPLTGLVERIPVKAMFYTVVPETDHVMAQALMKRIAGRRKLSELRVLKDDIKHAAFEPTNRMVIYYA